MAAGLPDDRRSRHVLCHTFCTHLADAGADTAFIRELAGHADIRTTTIYTAVNAARLEHAIAERAYERRGARRAAAGAGACGSMAGTTALSVHLGERFAP